MMKNNILFIMCSLVLMSSSLFGGFKQDLKEAQKSFFYKKNPIHPAIIRQFVSLNNGPSSITQMDIKAASSSNEYNQPYGWEKKEITLLCHMEKEDETSFDYQWLGKLENGCHVVRTYENCGSKDLLMNLFWFKISEGKAQSSNFSYQQLLLTVVRKDVLDTQSTIKLLLNDTFIVKE